MKFSHSIPSLQRITNRHKFLAAYVEGKKVLHGGCVDSGLLDQRLDRSELLHQVLTDHASEVVGVDVDGPGIKKMKALGYTNVVHADLETWEYNSTFDVIVLGEIIEHIDNCGMFLDTVRRYCTEDTEVILTTPNAYYYLFWLYTLGGRESIHPDHNYLFSFNSLEILLGKFGFKVERHIILWEGVKFLSPGDRGLKRMIKSLVSGFVDLLRLMRFIFPQYGKGLIVVAKRK